MEPPRKPPAPAKRRAPRRSTASGASCPQLGLHQPLPRSIPPLVGSFAAAAAWATRETRRGEITARRERKKVDYRLTPRARPEDSSAPLPFVAPAPRAAAAAAGNKAAAGRDER